MTSTCTDPIDLGFNGDIEDKCDYLDYSAIDLDTDHDQRKLTVIQLNIRGLLNKQEELNRLLSEIKRIHTISVILLAETWLKKTTKKKIEYQDSSLWVSTGNAKEGEVLAS